MEQTNMSESEQKTKQKRFTLLKTNLLFIVFSTSGVINIF